MVNRSTMSATKRWGVRAFLAALCALLTIPKSEAEISATLTPESVPAGVGAELMITVNYGSITKFSAPEVPGLIMNGPIKGFSADNSTGVFISIRTFQYFVGSNTVGEYDIPPFTLTVDGVEVQTQPLKLKVTTSASQAPAGLPPGASGGQTPAAPVPVAGEPNMGYLTIDPAGKQRRHAWVGEIAPVRIQAWLPADVRPTQSAPVQPRGSSFTLHNLSPQPQQSLEVHEGKRYLVVTWYGGLSATKAGSSPPDLSMKINIQIPDPSGQRQRSGDPFIDQFLGARMIQKEVELHSKTDASANLEIRSLPKEGRPDNFEGAVGKFAFGRTQIPGQWKTGEPQQIGAEIDGEGNFNLLKQPTLKSDRDWKSYEGQSSFTAKDVVSFTGTSTFRFSQVPRQAGPQQVRLAFSYFDPDRAAYQTVETPPQAIEVTGVDLPPEPAAPVAESAAPPVPAAPALAPQRSRPGFAGNLTPPNQRSFFTFLKWISGTVIVISVCYQPLRRRLGDPRRRARAAAEQALRQAMGEAESAAARSDVPGFFAAARRAIQARLAQLWQRPASAITLADVTRHLAADSPVIALFQEADRQEFSPVGSLPAAELSAWRTRLEQALASLTASPA
jgi:hypothetical protein